MFFHTGRKRHSWIRTLQHNILFSQKIFPVEITLFQLARSYLWGIFLAVRSSIIEADHQISQARARVRASALAWPRPSGGGCSKNLGTISYRLLLSTVFPVLLERNWPKNYNLRVENWPFDKDFHSIERWFLIEVLREVFIRLSS